MLVITIIGILAAIGLPAFQNHKVRAKLAEGHVVFDSIKKGEIAYFAENDSFAWGELAEGHEPDLLAVMNGQKYLPGANSVLLSKIGAVVPRDQGLGIWVQVLTGGYDKQMLSEMDFSNVKIGRSVGTGSECYNNPDYLGLFPSDFGIPAIAGSRVYHWFMMVGISGYSYANSPNCIYQVQYAQTWSSGLQTSGMIELK